MLPQGWRVTFDGLCWHYWIVIRLAFSSDCELPHRGTLHFSLGAVEDAFSWLPHYLSVAGDLQLIESHQLVWRMQMAPSLPPMVWGSTLIFLPYTDVRSSLRTGRVFRCNVTEHIEVLNVFSPLEMDVLMGRRFSNATEVNIICL